jgi:hypothetical protein
MSTTGITFTRHLVANGCCGLSFDNANDLVVATIRERRGNPLKLLGSVVVVL